MDRLVRVARSLDKDNLRIFFKKCFDNLEPSLVSLKKKSYFHVLPLFNPVLATTSSGILQFPWPAIPGWKPLIMGR